ncbi:hypothetical protein BTT_65500 (plasmid) [Bacillus thuringiensis serovar morrisoni str. 4AA1]|uniref:hypothetical protein n=1 Tax=Bacillus TaxID=1386 RepID=UPI001298A776|nr:MULTISPECIES: hypothetical protein [Bacillus]MED3102286.1 hypothetical protein [Bacillus thuringiensis]MRA99921.1 hypothetical protein [Bacillus thuringiensis]UEL01409.1 hypothetical protein K8Z23_30790 [Bacillus thuringiensis]UOC05297.1 hypothetical protein BTT_65500 [Bacillus thuringiensis serovar morrisoni str. 4AA1]UPJ19411.1 hypothetical protein MYW48_29025 [Bacillus cereus]
MLKNLVDFVFHMFPMIVIPLGVFAICVGIKAICRDISEIKEMDKEKISLKK